MGRLAIIDGQRRPPEQATISVYDRGFLYGDSVFETIRTYGGRLFALEEHLERLEESAEKMGFALPVGREELAAETRTGVEASGNEESYARVMVTRGVGPLGLDTTLAQGPCRVILVEPLKTPPAEHYRTGIDAICVETVRASDAAESAKIGNYLASALALKKAKEAGAHEALVVNRDGLVVEGTTANIFVVRRGRLCTPDLGIGVLAGITRKEVLAAAEAMDITVDFATLTPAEILGVDEVFLTSSIRELMPVVRVDGHPIGDGEPGEITRQLHRAFRKRVGLDGRLPHEG